ncbi:MAG: L-rhamnose isomerase, partial [Verrucomicrobiota bacterium]|nr:L-rhamnose isomerase [Verrucomicrobiota bacterium]
SHRDDTVRRYWIEHGKACRRIASDAARQIGHTVVTNFWIPDGHKDLPADRKAPRERLAAALDEIFAEDVNQASSLSGRTGFQPAGSTRGGQDARPTDQAGSLTYFNLDAVESKLFGIGSESYVVGSHEFYLGYAVTRQKLLCLDAGHFHPTESLADKVSSVLQFVPGLLLHVSRGVRWDSDHVVLLDDATRAVMEEVVRGGFLDRTYIGLDFFDASINRIAAWVIGTRNAIKALLLALLEPAARLRESEEAGDFTARLALLEELKSLPFAAVWDEHCRRSGVPIGSAWLDEVRGYEKTVLAKRA